MLNSGDLIEKLNQYFVSVFTEDYRTNMPSAQVLFHGNAADKLLDITITKDTVLRKFDSLCTDKAAGADDMAIRVLVELKDVISVPITRIINASIQSGVVLDEWKLANVTPVHKTGSKGYVGNYHPISLTSQICKLYESIIRDAVIDHLDKHGLIKKTQRGFSKVGSCLNNQIRFLDKVTGHLDADESVDIICLDFSQAFDKVPCHTLLLKL